jgi:hypothetical protein
VVPGSGMALGFEDPAQKDRLVAWLDEVSRMAACAGATCVSWGPPGATAESAASPPAADATSSDDGAVLEPGAEDDKAPGPLVDQIRAMTAQQRMQLAAHGERAARLILLKDPNRTIQSFVLQNPHVTLEEVRYLAGFRQATPDVLQAIAGHREWSQNPGVLAALVRNPRTPLGAAVRLLDRLPETELRRLSKSPDVPRGVQLAARKRIND